MKYKAAFVLNCRDKAGSVARAVQGALSQTYPCHILLSDQASTDGSFEVMEKTVADTPLGHKDHRVELLRCPIEGKYGMEAANAHTLWIAQQTDADWIVQCSADDYSLPGRVAACMAAADVKDAACIATTVYFTFPGEEIGPQTPISGFPREDGYVRAGEGLTKMAYGSTIHCWSREWLLKIGTAGSVTPDVFYGFLAALDRGFYVIATPYHVHVRHADLNNMGFEGKMRAAEASGDQDAMDRINELNRFQLFELYLRTAEAATRLYPLAHDADKSAVVNMAWQQACGWYAERKKLHARGVMPGII